MNKREVVDEIRAYLTEELSSLRSQAGVPSAKPADDDMLARIHELEQQLTMYKFLPIRDFSGDGEVVCPAALVELELSGRTAYYFVVPSGGGLVMRIEGQPVQVITPNSPLGEVLMGRHAGETVRVQAGGKPREYRIVSLL